MYIILGCPKMIVSHSWVCMQTMVSVVVSNLYTIHWTKSTSRHIATTTTKNEKFSPKYLVSWSPGKTSKFVSAKQIDTTIKPERDWRRVPRRWTVFVCVLRSVSLVAGWYSNSSGCQMFVIANWDDHFRTYDILEWFVYAYCLRPPNGTKNVTRDMIRFGIVWCLTLCWKCLMAGLFSWQWWLLNRWLVWFVLNCERKLIQIYKLNYQFQNSGFRQSLIRKE